MTAADAQLAERLDAYLDARGATRQALIEAVGDSFGEPLLVVATGSVLHGVGNRRSDLDLNVVVPREVSRFPIAAFAGQARLDITFYNAGDVQAWTHELAAERWPAAGPLPAATWLQHVDRLFGATRFAGGLALSAHDDWRRWQAGLREPWLQQQVEAWWRIEAVRRRTAAAWLSAARPLLAAQRQCEALCAALEHRAARAGQAFFGAKWLPEKLRLLQDRAGQSCLRAALAVPGEAAAVPAYLERGERWLTEIGEARPDGLAAQLWYRPSTRVRALDGRTLLSRWDRRGLEVDGSLPASAEPPAPCWQGPLGTLPPPGLLAAFVEDLTWLSVVAA